MSAILTQSPRGWFAIVVVGALAALALEADSTSARYNLNLNGATFKPCW
jgi:hypothetical protein